MMKNSERLLVGCVERYAAARGLLLRKHSQDWILQLLGPSWSHTVFGYDVGLNSSSAHRLANDKSAAFDVLNGHDIPAVEHRVFLHPRFLDFVDNGGNWRGLLKAFADFAGDIVVKDNEGTGGYEVVRVRSEIELEQAVLKLSQVARSLAVSPFLPIAAERRYVMLGEACVLAYRKDRMEIIGDGTSTTGALIAAARASGALRLELAEIDNPDVHLDRVLPPGKRLPLQWRHNLGRGARAVRLDPGSPAATHDLTLALRAMAALSLDFASVDLVDVGEATRVLEVNSGVMMEMLARTDPNGPALVDTIYFAALDRAIGRYGR